MEKEAHLVCLLMEGREQRKPVNGFFPMLPVSFLLAEPVVHPFTVIVLSCECKYILSSVSLSGESLNMWVVLGTFKTNGKPKVG